MVTLALFSTAVMAVALILVYVPLEYCILLPFCSIMWLGEGFRLGQVLPFGPHVALFGIVLLKRFMRRRPRALIDVILRNGPLALFCLMSAGSVLYGVALGAPIGGAIGDVSTILYFVAMYAVIAATPDLNMRRLITGVVSITALAVVKVLYLYAVPVGARWDNDWQASVLVWGSGLSSRIILNGADVFFVLAAAFPVSNLMIKPQISKLLSAVPALGMIVIGLLLCSTRSNWVGFAVIIFSQILIVSCRILASGAIRSKSILGVALLLAIAGAFSISGDYSPLPILQARFAEGDTRGSLSLRAAERDALLESVGSSFLFGRGMGSQYPDPIHNGEPTGFNHNAYLYLYLKMGLVGVLLYVGILAHCCGRFWHRLMGLRETDDLILHLGMLSALLGLCVLSLTVNKLFDVSGALFTGLAVGMCHQVKRIQTSFGYTYTVTSPCIVDRRAFSRQPE